MMIRLSPILLIIETNYYTYAKVISKSMVVGDLVGEIAVCSDCHQKKKIALELSRATAKDGQIYSPFLRCEDCAKLQLEKDKM